MRYLLISFSVLILASSSLYSNPISLWDNMQLTENHPTAIMNDFFIPEDITLENDALKGNIFQPETWYIEGFFNNSYSMVFILTLLQGLTREALLAGLYIYKDGHISYETRTLVYSPNVKYSLDKPLVKIEEKEVMAGYLDDDGRINYNVSFENNGVGIHLHFYNRTQGWQGKMGDGWWLAIPDLEILGTLTLQGENIPVTGRGYHDHNIFHPRSPLRERGYSDGKFHGDNLSFVWGKIFHTQHDTDTLAILSTEGYYISIPQPQLLINETSYVFDHGHRIPTEISISFRSETEDEIEGSLVMTSKDFHHIRLPFLFYWRYHAQVQGTISMNGVTYEIEKEGMMELMLY